MGKLSGLISSSYGFTVEAANALSHPPPGAQSAHHTSNYGYYSRTQNAPLHQQPNAHLSSQERRELPFPVIIPQRRPQNKSRGWARAYAPALAGTGIDESTFLDFIDRFNEESKASPYLHVVNVAGAGVGFLPGITPMIVSMAVPVAVKAAKKAQSNHQTESYLDKMNKKLFEPHKLYAIVMTYNAQESGDSLNVDMSSNSSPTQSQYQSYQPPDSGYTNTLPAFTLPESCPLIFVDSAPPKTFDPSRNGFLKMADFVSDFKDRRAQASFLTSVKAQENPVSTLVGPKPTFTNKYADPGYASSQNGNPPPRPMQKEEKKPGMFKGMKEKVMHSDVLYLMIVNNPNHAVASLPVLETAKRGGSTYQYGPPPSRARSPQIQQEPLLKMNNLRQPQYSSTMITQQPRMDNRQTQGPSTYQYGPLPSRLSNSHLEYQQPYNGPASNGRSERFTGHDQNLQTRLGQNGLGGFPPGAGYNDMQHKHNSPDSNSNAPPEYTPYPKDDWGEWQ
ncbi:hypothetical protein VTL71DRAFT_10040 [Oculimacula yallundae]|uniref:Uncharacterized protein n=1 Tax=Oculimacula yallundae TaxID=86028 RepID=A0ABR4BQ78_9HELO